MPKPHQFASTTQLDDCLWQAAIDLTPFADSGGTQADVVIVGGGFTGLWTAYWLKKLAPQLHVTVLEKHRIGHGASGRNGGWLMGSLEGLPRFAQGSGKLSDGVLAELRGLLGAVANTLEEEAIDCDLRQGGGVFGASRYAAQEPRARAMLRELHSLGFEEHDYRWLSAEELQSRFRVSVPRGAIETPHVATLHPGKLLRGLASAVIRRGVDVKEQCAALSFDKHTIDTSRGVIHPKHIVIATEGYSEEAPMARRLLSVRSGMVCTEPMTDAQWTQLGFEGHEAFCDLSRASTYLQRTADNRLVVGARGNYTWGNKPWHSLAASQKGTHQRLHLAKALFPALEGVAFTHAWEGSLGIPRRFAPHIVFDSKAHMATAGGYMGEGVGASYLFGRTLAEGITGSTSSRLHMPWVMHGDIRQAIPRWEFEPLPWLGFSTMMAAVALEDAMLSNNTPGTQLVTALCNALESLLGLH